MGPNGLADVICLISWAAFHKDMANRGVVLREPDRTRQVGLTCTLQYVQYIPNEAVYIGFTVASPRGKNMNVTATVYLDPFW